MSKVATTLRTAYLAGPMRGYEGNNFPAFHKATKKLRQDGWTIFSPAERDEADEALNGDFSVGMERGLDYYMQFDLAAVAQADCVIVLEGWEHSQGARLETNVAVELGHPVFEMVMKWGRRGKYDLRSLSGQYIQSMFALNAAAGPLHPEVGGCQGACGNCECDLTAEEADALQAATGISAGELKAITTPITQDGEFDPKVLDAEWYADVQRRAGTSEQMMPSDNLVLGPTPADIIEAANETLQRFVEALPQDSAGRKAVPITSGVLDYFPAALVEVARVSKAGNDKHNPGEPLHHARSKSTDHADSLLRHLIDRGKIDAETGQRHSAEVAWRALALLQQELEDAGLAPLPRGARIE